MAPRLPRFDPRRRQAEDARLAKLLDEADRVEAVTGVTAGGDESRLRGIPAIGRGVAGAIRGTRPGENLR